MRLSRQELRFVSIFSLCLITITSIPYFLGHTLPFQQSRFNENLVFDSDMNAYFAFMRQSATGDWLFYNPFTPEPHKAVFFNFEWLTTGKLGALFGGSLEAAFQIERIFSIIVMSFALYWLTSYLFSSLSMRRVVFIMAMLGGGFNWLLDIPLLGTHLPQDVFLDTRAGFHPYFWVLLQPHFLISQALSILTLCLFMRAEVSGLRKDYAQAAIMCGLVGSIRPFDMLFLVLVITIYILVIIIIKKSPFTFSSIFPRLLPILVSIPIFLYYLWLLKIHPVFRWWSIQNVKSPPQPLSLLVTLGIPIILVIFSLDIFWKLNKATSPQILIIICFFSSLILFYSYPILKFTLQFATAILIPTIFVGTMKLEPWFLKMTQRTKWTYAGVAILIFVNSLTSVKLTKSYIESVFIGEHRTDIHLLDAFEWLNLQSEPRDNVLSSCATGNQIPRYTHNTTFCGYKFTTVNFSEKRDMVEQFFSDETDDSYRHDMLEKYDIRYVFLDLENGESNGFDPSTTSLLREIFRNEVAIIYQVVRTE